MQPTLVSDLESSWCRLCSLGNKSGARVVLQLQRCNANCWIIVHLLTVHSAEPDCLL